MKRNNLKDDPRASAKFIASLERTGSHVAAPELPLDATADRETLLGVVAGAEKVIKGLLNANVSHVSPPDNVSRSIFTIPGVDNNDIVMYVHRPTSVAEGVDLPCVYHIHGGGMCVLEASYDFYSCWRSEIATHGVLVIGVEYRNSGGSLGCHPYPAGLNDCMSGLKYIQENKKSLGISTVVVSGESGGGNLALATCLFAKKLGLLHYIDGVFAQCPYISNKYNDTETAESELRSLGECNCYILDGVMLDIMATLYTPRTGGKKCTDPLAWPYHATLDDLKDLPPHVVVVNELDPLRDEGVSYYRKLVTAGVDASCKMLMGTTHAAETSAARLPMPDVVRSAIHDVVQFAKNVGKQP